MVTGRCLCGAVAFEVSQPLSAPTLCHCGMCRRLNGASGAYTGAPAASYRLRGEESLNWYGSSTDAERGFCRICGSKLFWREVRSPKLDVTMGSLDTPTGLKLAAHIWASHQGDYYAIGGDGVPHYAESAEGSGPIPAAPAPEPGIKTRVHTGGCQCGGVRFRLTGNIRDVVSCHCGQCRRAHGHAPGYSAARKAEMTLEGADTVAWYDSSEHAQRGFCRRCGSSLFWQRKGVESISISAGALDTPTGLRTVRHIYTAEKSDYYAIADGVPQSPGSMTGDPVTF